MSVDLVLVYFEWWVPVICGYFKIFAVYDRFLKLWCEMKWSRSVVSSSLQPQGLYSPWNFSGQNSAAGSLFLLQGVFPPREIKPRSPALQVDSLPAEPQGKPFRIEGLTKILNCLSLTKVFHCLGFISN